MANKLLFLRNRNIFSTQINSDQCKSDEHPATISPELIVCTYLCRISIKILYFLYALKKLLPDSKNIPLS